MHAPLRAALLAAVLAVGLMPAAAPAGEPLATDDISSETMSFVRNLPLDRTGESTRVATDTDFMTFEVPEGFALPEDFEATRQALLPDATPLPDGLLPQPGQEREFALVGSYVDGLYVIDVTEPEQAEVVTVYDCGVSQGDVFVFERAIDGEQRTFAAYTSDDGFQHDFETRCQDEAQALGHMAFAAQRGTYLVDVTNPYDPQLASFIPFDRGTHQVTVHPDGEWLYSSPSNRTVNTARPSVGQLDIADISDPFDPGEPVAVPFLTGFDSHDLSFNAEGTRAYAAGLSHTVILDTTEPGDPQVISSIVDPAIQTHHEAHKVVAADPVGGEREFLLINDELLGAGGNGYCPGGGLHIYDITGELEHAPVKVGAWYAPELNVQEGGRGGLGGLVRCTAHVMQIHPDEGLMTMAWFGAGTRVIDVSGFLGGLAFGIDGQQLGAGMPEIGYLRFPDTDAWASKTNRVDEDGFYVYAIDTVRGFDVLRFDFDAEAASAAEHGRFVSPAQALRDARQRDALLGLGGGAVGTGPYCTLPAS